MTKCPYPEKLQGGNGVEYINYQYQYWHEGYEAHKLEIMEKVKSIQKYEDELISEITKNKMLNSRLHDQINSTKQSENG